MQLTPNPIKTDEISCSTLTLKGHLLVKLTTIISFLTAPIHIYLVVIPDFIAPEARTLVLLTPPLHRISPVNWPLILSNEATSNFFLSMIFTCHPVFYIFPLSLNILFEPHMSSFFVLHRNDLKERITI